MVFCRLILNSKASIRFARISHDRMAAKDMGHGRSSWGNETTRIRRSKAE